MPYKSYVTASINDCNYREFVRNMNELERVQGSVEYYLELGNMGHINPLTEELNSLLTKAIKTMYKLFDEYEERCYQEWINAMDEATDEAIEAEYVDEEKIKAMFHEPRALEAIL